MKSLLARCQFTTLGKEARSKKQGPDVKGDYYGMTTSGYVKVKWDGHKTITTYAKEFIEIIGPPES
jgi:hypothetical protein